MNQSRIQIAHVVCTYPPYRGGIGNVASAMVMGLRERDYDVTVFTPDYGDSTPPQNQVRKLKPVLKLGNAAWLPQLHKELSGFDLIHLHYPFFGGAEAVAYFKRKHPAVPLIVTYHMDTVGQGWKRFFFSLHAGLIGPSVLRRANRVLVSSNDYAEHSRLLRSARIKQLFELPFGVPDVFTPSQKAVSPQELSLLFVANLDQAHYFKGLSVLLDALALLNKTAVVPVYKGLVRLLVVGGGGRQSFYERRAREKGIAEQVRFLGKLSQEQLLAAYRQSDVTVLPSTDRSEAFGMVLAESMACGTPVIASNLPGVRTLVQSGATGLLVSPSNVFELATAINTLAVDSPLRQRLGQAAARRIDEQYRWPRILDQLESLYKAHLNAEV